MVPPDLSTQPPRLGFRDRIGHCCREDGTLWKVRLNQEPVYSVNLHTLSATLQLVLAPSVLEYEGI